VPLPLHAKRYLHRRSNQSAKLARLLCQQNQTVILAPKTLTWPKAGPTQAGLSQSQRQRIANRPVLLIDDVMTTGAILYEAAKIPHRARSGPVRGLVLQRVLRHGL
jgi:predicted amidophosphoribosyltransferase